MTSRERVQAALNHKQPDMLPIDFGAHKSSGIAAIAYNKLKKVLGYSQETTKVYDVWSQLAWPEPAILERMGADVLQVPRLYAGPNIKMDRWKCSHLVDGTPCMEPYEFNPVKDEKGNDLIVDPELGTLLKRPVNGLYFDSARYYLEGTEDLDELKEKLVLPTVDDADLNWIETNAKDLYYNTDKALLMHVGCSVFEQGQQDFGFEDFYYNLAGEPEMIHYWADKMTDAYCVNLEKMLDRVAPYIDMALFGGDDLGTQISSQLSPQMYREMIKPYHKKIYQFVHEKYPKLKVGLHSCGAIHELIPDLIDAGVDVLNPIQISAKDMDPQDLKKEFGKDIVFWGGGADMQGFVSATEDLKAIYNHVRREIEILSEDSGFVFTQVHNILADVSPEKVLTIYQAALDFRKEQKGL